MGCSWTYGVGVGYDENTMLNQKDTVLSEYTKENYNSFKGKDYPSYDNFLKNRTNKNYFQDHVLKELLEQFSSNAAGNKRYRDIAWHEPTANEYSFRGIISKSLDLENNNFSVGGSSNDLQFHRMSCIFGNPALRKKFLKSNPIVLWGITSTGRIMRNGTSIMLDPEIGIDVPPGQKKYVELYLQLGYYDHKQLLESLSHQIEMWNILFEKYNIPVLWFDTFNTHDYKIKPRNFLPGGDLLTQMLNMNKSKFSKALGKYHYSTWRADDSRINEGIRLKLLNPISMHPTKEGHKLISKILMPYITKLRGKQ
tara:strand:- start:38 stop:967 length:930 start_codon:yes stop_codon:yes gene_type:complete